MSDTRLPFDNEIPGQCPSPSASAPRRGATDVPEMADADNREMHVRGWCGTNEKACPWQFSEGGEPCDVHCLVGALWEITESCEDIADARAVAREALGA